MGVKNYISFSRFQYAARLPLKGKFIVIRELGDTGIARTNSEMEVKSFEG
jgi:hypothetical protein